MQEKNIVIKCKNLDESVKENCRVKVFYFQQQNHFKSIDSLSELLSNEEKNRVKLFRFDRDKFSYIVCHGFLRIILSEELKTDPKKIPISTDKNDKPFVNGQKISFNISHTKEMCAVAVSKETEVGIDIEKLKDNKHFKDIAKRNFTLDEQKILSGSNDPLTDFLLIWTRKESFLKNIGTGIKAGLKNINVGKERNLINHKLITKYVIKEIADNFSVYSGKIEDHILSVAISGDSFPEIKQFQPK